MYAVIFRAEIARLDTGYSAMAARLRELALSEYGCREFTSCSEGAYEIAISYWDTQAQIAEWKSNAEHLVAQGKGQAGWYKSYAVEVVEVVRTYDWDSMSG